MLTLTHDLLRISYPEQYAWMFMNAVLPDWQASYPRPHRHDFKPLLGWEKVDAPEEHAARVGDLPSSTYRDPTGTVHMTLAVNGEVLPIFITGEGWEVGCTDAHAESFEELETPVGGRWGDNWPFHFYD